MYVIPLMRCLRATPPDKSHLFHLVLNLSALHRGWLLLLLYSFVSSVCQRKREKANEGGIAEEGKEYLEISHREVAI